MFLFKLCQVSFQNQCFSSCVYVFFFFNLVFPIDFAETLQKGPRAKLIDEWKTRKNVDCWHDFAGDCSPPMLGFFSQNTWKCWIGGCFDFVLWINVFFSFFFFWKIGCLLFFLCVCFLCVLILILFIFIFLYLNTISSFSQWKRKWRELCWKISLFFFLLCF